MPSDQLTTMAAQLYNRLSLIFPLLVMLRRMTQWPQWLQQSFTRQCVTGIHQFDNRPQSHFSEVGPILAVDQYRLQLHKVFEQDFFLVFILLLKQLDGCNFQCSIKNCQNLPVLQYSCSMENKAAACFTGFCIYKAAPRKLIYYIQLTLSFWLANIQFSSLQVFPISLHSSFTVVRYIFLGRPTRQLLWGSRFVYMVQSVMELSPFLKVWPIHCLSTISQQDCRSWLAYQQLIV